MAPLPAHSHGHGGPQPRGDQADTGGEPFLPRYLLSTIPADDTGEPWVGPGRGAATTAAADDPVSSIVKGTGVLEGHSPRVKVTVPELSKYPEHTQTERPNS